MFIALIVTKADRLVYIYSILFPFWWWEKKLKTSNEAHNFRSDSHVHLEGHFIFRSTMYYHICVPLLSLTFILLGKVIQMTSLWTDLTSRQFVLSQCLTECVGSKSALSEAEGYLWIQLHGLYAANWVATHLQWADHHIMFVHLIYSLPFL